MKQRLQKYISGFLTVSTALTLSGISLANSVQAAQITEAKATLSVVTSGSSSNHTVAFKNKSTTSIKKVIFQYTVTASSGATVPDSFDSSSAATKQSVTVNGSDDTSNWTLDRSVNGTLTYTATAAVSSPAVGTPFIFVTNSIANNVLGGGNPCDAISESDSCFIRITTQDAGSATIDTATTTYTIINSITVSATIDPSLNFTITGVNSGTTNDANQGGSTSVTSTATTLPLGNVTLGTAKRAQQALTVTTNANNGYTVYYKSTSAEILAGSYSGNNIDGFIGSGGNATWPEDGGAGPQTWATPTGSAANVNSGWLGVRSNNAGLTAGFNASNVYAPAYNGAGSGKEVMKKATPDNGGTSTYVTYQIQANAYQPSDSYTGTLVYNVVASY